MDSYLQRFAGREKARYYRALQSLFSWIHICNQGYDACFIGLRAGCNPCFHGFISATPNPIDISCLARCMLQSLFSWIHICNFCERVQKEISRQVAILVFMDSYLQLWKQRGSFRGQQKRCNPCFHGFISATDIFIVCV